MDTIILLLAIFIYKCFDKEDDKPNCLERAAKYQERKDLD